MKLKSTADGLKAVKVNLNREDTPAWHNFEANNPELPLVKQMPGNTVFEGVDAEQYLKDDKWCYDEERPYHGSNMGYPIRSAYAPLEVKEQVREEAPKNPFAFGFALMNKIGNPVKQEASNPELGVEEAAETHSDRAVGSSNASNYLPEFISAIRIRAKRSFIAGANHIIQSGEYVKVSDMEKVFEQRIAELDVKISLTDNWVTQSEWMARKHEAKNLLTKLKEDKK